MRLHRSAPRSDEVTASLSGDALIPDATATMDRAASFDATPDEVWPWIAQLGKGRGGWYFPRWLDAVTPKARRSLRRIDTTLQHPDVGDEHPDWGPGNPLLEVVEVDPGRTIVYYSVRGEFRMSWQLLLTAEGTGTRLHLRLRVRTKTKVLTTLGDAFDWATVELLFAGLRERLAA